MFPLIGKGDPISREEEKAAFSSELGGGETDGDKDKDKEDKTRVEKNGKSDRGRTQERLEDLLLLRRRRRRRRNHH